MQRSAFGIGVALFRAAVLLALFGLAFLFAASGPAARSPASPSPVRLLYASDWSGSSEIYAVDPVTGHRRGQLTFGPAPACVPTNPCGYMSPVPSPDGRRLVFGDLAIEGPRRPSLFVAHADGSDRRRLARVAPYFATPVWSPDSRRIAFAVRDGIRVADADGNGSRLVDRGVDSDPAWSRDGGSLAFVRGTAAGEELVVFRRGVEHVVGEDRSSSPRLVFAWSPTGSWLAFSAATGSGSRTGDLDLVHPDGTGRRRLLDSSHTVDFAWSPSGRWLAVSSDSTNAVDVVRTDGSGRRRLFNAEASDLAWSADGGSLAFCCANGLGLFVADLATESLHPVSTSAPYSVSWSPRRHLLAFAAADGLHVRDAAGRTRTITRDQPVLELWSPDGRWIAYTTSEWPRSPTFYLRVASVSGRVRTLFSSDADYGGMLWGFNWARKPATVHYRRPARRSLATLSPDQLTAPWSIERIAADGDRVAYVACGHVFVWTPAARTVMQTEPVASMSPNCRTGNYSTSYEVYDLALAGDRLVYASSEGCNSIRIDLRLEEVAQPITGSDIAQTSGNCGGPFRPAVGELAASGALLVYGEWWETSATPVLPPSAITSEQIHRIDGNTCPCPTIASSPGPLYPADVDHDRVLAYGNNATLLLDHDGIQLLSLPISPLAAQLAGTDLVLLLHGELRDYDSHNGALLHTWPMPDVTSGPECAWRTCSDNRLVLDDAARGLVTYTLDGHVHLLRLADGADATIGAGTVARFMDAGLVYADGADLRLVPFDRLPLR